MNVFSRVNQVPGLADKLREGAPSFLSLYLLAEAGRADLDNLRCSWHPCSLFSSLRGRSPGSRSGNRRKSCVPGTFAIRTRLSHRRSRQEENNCCLVASLTPPLLL